jgi:hypothetical protein
MKKEKKPMSKGKRMIIFIVLVTIIYIAFTSGEEPSKVVKEVEEEVKEEVKEEPIETIKVTSTELISSFNDNEIKANDSYKDKVLEVVGKLKEVKHSEVLGKEQYTVVLTNNEEYNLLDIWASGNDKFKDKMMELSKDTEVTIVGKCKGSVAGLYIELELMEIK